MSITVRLATPADLPQLALLFDAYRVFYEQPSDVERAEAFLAERFELGDALVFVAEAPPEGRLVGFTQLFPSLSSVSTARIYVLNDLFVAPDARRGGVAADLMRTAQDAARERGGVRVSLATALDNHGAQHLYERMGYERDTAFFHYDLALPRS